MPVKASQTPIKPRGFFIVIAEHPVRLAAGMNPQGSKEVLYQLAIFYNKVCPVASPNTPPRFYEGTACRGD